MPQYSSEKTYALFENPVNKKIIDEIAASGATHVLFPETQKREIVVDEINEILIGFSNFDWLLFTDVYAVDHFLAILEAKEVDRYELDELQICAVGESVADRLRYSQIHSDVITQSVKPEDILDSLITYISGKDGFEDKKFMVLKEESANIGITDILCQLRALVAEVPVYALENEPEPTIAKLKALIKGGAVDEFIFSSPSDLIDLSHLFQSERLDELLDGVNLSPANEATAQALAEYRLIEK